jgi:hypothetical protein
LNAGTASKLTHGDSQKIATALAFLQNPGPKILGVEAGSAEGFAPQPDL